MSGTKNDQGKPCFDRLSFQALGEMNKVHEAGDKKYEEGNWRKGLDVVRLANAPIRHISQFLDGEITDPETHTYHVANAAVSLEMIIHMLVNKEEYAEFINLPKRPIPKISRKQEAIWSGFVPSNWQELMHKDLETFEKSYMKDVKADLEYAKKFYEKAIKEERNAHISDVDLGGS